MNRRTFIRRSILATGTLSVIPQCQYEDRKNHNPLSSNSIVEQAHSLPVCIETDVVVCGGGPAGFTAAVAAARMGVRTLLIEQYGFLGGMATAGMVGPLSKFNFNGERIVDGIPGEFIRAMHDMNGAIIDLPSGNVPYDVEAYKITAQRMVQSSGASVLLHTLVAGVKLKEPGKLSHVIVETKSGRFAISARMFIDCTGTGDLIVKTSLPWEMRNRNTSGELQPMTLYFRLGGVDTCRLTLLMANDGVKYANPVLREILQEEVRAGRLRNFGGPWTVHGSTIRPGEVSVNVTRIGGNGADVHDLSKAELVLREEIYTIIDIFRKRHQAFSNCYLIDTASQIGIRETRTIHGLYTMTANDVLEPQNFPDTVARGGHPIDIHLSGDTQQNARFITRPYNIPYRTLVPENSENLLVAGALLSATREAFGTIRVQAQCMALGQAAGTAAALCIINDVSVSELNGVELRKHLKTVGALV
ncbi:FAD-dependent oxidoreductase [Parabacteroides sp. Marseille-P3160]|uniref:FAD-dependent oxidoreductase n=1 Tax=Parabacteroides sp. Marseille-P3160 TaxID=1917887 RepID=UPI0009BA5E3F|nr:FAD-dependent oxidoreductase [Parabacteroides sp. Marseille-P3160]